MNLKPIIAWIIVTITTLPAISQEIKFSTLQSYFEGGENYIKAQLKSQNFLIEKERKSDVSFFDTQISASKGGSTDLSLFKAISILKINGTMVSLVYVTLNNSDFNKKTNEIKQNGFLLTSENNGMQWVYEKGNMIVTVEKRVITIQGKDFLRYEIGISDKSKIGN